jgi:hypothetical protein
VLDLGAICGSSTFAPHSQLPHLGQPPPSPAKRKRAKRQRTRSAARRRNHYRLQRHVVSTRHCLAHGNDASRPQIIVAPSTGGTSLRHGRGPPNSRRCRSDALALLLLAVDQQPWRFHTAAPRWHARLCAEARLTIEEAQLALAALQALGGAGAYAGGQALTSICGVHGIDDAAGVLDAWLDARD